jgi:type VI secretion system secreted protein Hcp
MKRLLFCIALVSGLLVYDPVLAAVNLYLKLDGIEGEGKDEAHQGWIDLFSYQFGVARPSTGQDGESQRGASFSDLTITKFVDKSSPSLLFDTASETHIEDATIDVVKAGTDKSKPFLEYTLSKVLVSNIISGGVISPESVSLNFAAIQMKYSPQNSDGTLGKPISMEWNILKDQGSLSGVGSVPEPSSWAMVAAGVLLLALRARKMMQSSTR